MHKQALAFQVAVAVAASVAIPAFAQQENTSKMLLEEVVVTAQKRAESMQDVPISVQAFSAEGLDKLGANVLSDLEGSAPSLEFGGLGKGSQQQMGIRGLVDFARNVGIDSRMGIYIDGVYQGRSYTADVPLLGLASVEILRGPQGTLFGKNTVSGAISLNTKKPADEFAGQFGAALGNHSMKKATAYLTGPFSDTFSGSLSASYQDAEGYYKNINLGKDIGDWDTGALRAQLRYTPTDKLELLLAGDYANKHSDVPLSVNSALEPYETQQSTVPEDDSETWGAALTANYSFDNDYTLTSITSFRHGEFNTIADDDYLPEDRLLAVFNEDSDQWSQEVRLISPKGDTYDWVAGLYYFDNDLTSDRNLDIGDAFYTGFLGPILQSNPDPDVAGLGGLLIDNAADLKGHTTTPAELTNTTFAAYLHGNYRFTERLELTAGVRYTLEEKDVEWAQVNTLDNPDALGGLFAAGGSLAGMAPLGFIGAVDSSVTDDLSDSNVSPTIGLNYFLNDGAMLYVKYARAFKSGGWNADFMTAGLDFFAYDTEEVDSYEIGFKSTLLDNSLRLNASAFISKFDEFQVFQRVFNATGNPSIQYTNAGQVTTQGVELESVWIPTDRLQLTLNATYLDAYYDEFLNQDGEDFADNELPFAPRWKTYLGVQYIQPLGDLGELAFNVDYSYTDEQYVDPKNAPEDLLDSYGTSNARLAFTPAGATWELALWGKNLSDKEYLRNSNLNFMRTARQAWATPRTYGISFNYFLGR